MNCSCKMILMSKVLFKVAFSNAFQRAIGSQICLNWYHPNRNDPILGHTYRYQQNLVPSIEIDFKVLIQNLELFIVLIHDSIYRYHVSILSILYRYSPNLFYVLRPSSLYRYKNPELFFVSILHFKYRYRLLYIDAHCWFR